MIPIQKFPNIINFGSLLDPFDTIHDPNLWQLNIGQACHMPGVMPPWKIFRDSQLGQVPLKMEG